jgi:hypothetical protein
MNVLEKQYEITQSEVGVIGNNIRKYLKNTPKKKGINLSLVARKSGVTVEKVKAVMQAMISVR